MKVKIKRFIDQPIISPLLSNKIGSNINGPSLIRVPDWITDPLGEYYLYFADHKGDRIKLAYSDNLSGPWKIHDGGTLHLKESHFLINEPDIPDDFDLAELGPRDAHPDQIPHIPPKISDLTHPHIASPDVHINEDSQLVIMYYHGLDEFGLQKTRVAVSSDGINFIARKQIVGWPYFKHFSYKGESYGISMPGIIYKKSGDIEEKAKNYTLPPMLLQTLVENGIKHGISKIPEGGTLHLTAKTADECLFLTIKNSGQLEEDESEEVGFGLINTKQRLNLLYGSRARFSIKNEDKKNVIAEIVIPNNINQNGFESERPKEAVV